MISLHKDGSPLLALQALQRVYPQWMSTAEVEAAIDRCRKIAGEACRTLYRDRLVARRHLDRCGPNGRPMCEWQFVPGRSFQVVSRESSLPVTRSAVGEEWLRAARKEASRQAHGGYPGYDTRYQVPPGTRVLGGFSTAGIGIDALTGKPWQA